jgi:hypothetical protein
MNERFQRCFSKLRTALVMTLMLLGLMRDLRKICQDFKRAMPRSTGARAADRVTVQVLPAVGDGPPLAVLTQRHDRGRGVQVKVRVAGHPGPDRARALVLDTPGERPAGSQPDRLPILAADRVPGPPLHLPEGVALGLVEQEASGLLPHRPRSSSR